LQVRKIFLHDARPLADNRQWKIAAEMRAAKINWPAVQDELCAVGVKSRRQKLLVESHSPNYQLEKPQCN